MDDDPAPDSEQTYRLPRTATPSRYDLTLEPSLDAGTFVGDVDIEIEVHEPLTEIVVNAKELDVLEGALGDARGALDRDREDRRGRRGRARVAASVRTRRARRVDAAPRVPGHAERPARRLLPLPLHRRRRRGARRRVDPFRGDGRPHVLPVLGRTGSESGVRRDARRGRRADRAGERAGGRAHAARRRARPGAVRGHDEDVDVPRVRRRRSPRADGAERRARRPGPRRQPSRGAVT